jgi:transcriptional regulator with XRE-family HTH domain
LIDWISEALERTRSAAEKGTEMTITGEQLKTARELLGWSRAQLAREAGMTVTAIADFENGKKQLAVIAISTIARILRTADAKLGREGAPVVGLRPAV